MEVEKEACERYAEAIDYSPEQLEKILVIDSCFIIELFSKNTYEELREEDDPIFVISYMIQFLSHDLILLENQVPWMVLEILFNLTQDSYDKNPLILLATNFFAYTYLSYRMPPQNQDVNIKDIEHFVDLFRKLSTLSSTDPGLFNVSISNAPSISLICSGNCMSTISSTLFKKFSSIIEENQE
jgi:hypothetical protein